MFGSSLFKIIIDTKTGDSLSNCSGFVNYRDLYAWPPNCYVTYSLCSLAQTHSITHLIIHLPTHPLSYLHPHISELQGLVSVSLP